MNAVALIFFTLNIHNPNITTGPEISDRMFKSHAECADFVNTITQQNVVDENYEFQFASIDGLLFKGGCYTEEEYNKLFKDLGVAL